MSAATGEKWRPRRPSEATNVLRLEDRRQEFRAVPFGVDGKPLPELDLRPLFQAILDIAVNTARDDMDDWSGP